jgi:hypothetical protein
MSKPANLIESASGRRRLPWQSGQSVPIMNCRARRFIIALSVFANEVSTWRRALLNVPW